MSPAPRLTEHDVEPVAAYRPVSVSAVTGLVLGLLSPFALLHPALWALPVVALAVSGMALRQIARSENERVGRKAALAGAAIALFFLSAAVVDWWAYRRLLVAEARQFGAAWFQYLAADEPQRAFALTIEPKYRPPLADDASLWEFYRIGPRWRRELEGFVANRPVRTLLALGDRARVCYWSHAGVARQDESEVVFPIFAVTFEDEGRPKTFFVMLTLQRTTQSDGRGDWHITREQGGVQPDDY